MALQSLCGKNEGEACTSASGAALRLGMCVWEGGGGRQLLLVAFPNGMQA